MSCESGSNLSFDLGNAGGSHHQLGSQFGLFARRVGLGQESQGGKCLGTDLFVGQHVRIVVTPAHDLAGVVILATGNDTREVGVFVLGLVIGDDLPAALMLGGFASVQVQYQSHRQACPSFQQAKE